MEKRQSIARRREIAQNIRKYRRWERSSAPSFPVNRTLKDYNAILKVNLVKVIRKVLERTTKNAEIRPLRVLDIGPGQGRCLRRLKVIFRNKITTASISLTKPKFTEIKTPSGPFKLIDEVHSGRIDSEKKLGIKKYGVIFSVFGIAYSEEIPKAIENVCNALDVEGIAFLHMMPEQLEEIGKFKNILSAAGIESRDYAAGVSPSERILYLRKKKDLELKLK